MGLFGCALGSAENPAFIRNLTVKNVDVVGFFLVGGVIGLQHRGCFVENVSLTGNNTVKGIQGVGGIVGTAFENIERCSAVADIVVSGDWGYESACAGIVAGGTEEGSLVRCTAQGGSIVAKGDDAWGIGGVSGAPYAAAEITDCKVQNVTITANGSNNRLIGGLAGFAGAYGDSDPAVISRCIVTGVAINVSDSTTCVGGLVGGSTEGSSQPLPSFFIVEDCSASGSIAGGGYPIGSIVGYAYRSTVKNCTDAVSWDGGHLEQVGLEEPARSFGSGSGSGCSTSLGVFELLVLTGIALIKRKTR